MEVNCDRRSQIRKRNQASTILSLLLYLFVCPIILKFKMNLNYKEYVIFIKILLFRKNELKVQF